jgi:hypothetical protein
VGINWRTSMEVGIRAVNWIWALSTLEAWRPIADPLRGRVAAALGVHGRHIAANLEGTPFLRSNHYIGDILGLLVIGAAVEGDPLARRCFRHAHRAFAREVHRQVLPDGLGFEASIPYHGLVLEMFLIAAHTAAVAGTPFQPRTLQRIRAMADASLVLRHPRGRAPNFGDNDSGRVLPATSDRELTHDHCLWLAAAVLGGPRPLPGAPDPEVAWTLGSPAWVALRSVPAETPEPTSHSFPDGGVFVLRRKKVYAAIRCGGVGQNGNGGHAHNDIMSFEASFDHTPVVVDSGTPCYTSDPSMRNAARATAAHNTVVIEGVEQRPIDPLTLFRLREHARPSVTEFVQEPGRLRFAAIYDGWDQTEPPIRHRRTVELDDSGRLTVLDHVDGVQAHRIQSLIHLASGATVERTRDLSFVIRCRALSISLTLLGAATDVTLEKGQVADRFGDFVAATVVAIRTGGPSFGFALAGFDSQ